MKKQFISALSLAAVLVSATLFTSCDEDSPKITLNVPYSITTSTLKADTTSFIGTKELDSMILEGNLDSVLAANSINKENVTGITINGVKLDAVDANGAALSTGNFAGLGGVQTSITLPTDGIEHLFAYNNAVRQDTSSIELTVQPNFQIIDYLKAPAFIIKAKGSTVAPITDVKFFKATISLTIKAQTGSAE